MDLFPTPEQELLVATARDFTTRSAAIDVVRALESSPVGFDREHWRTMAALGWPELGPLELVLVVESLGRAALPSPLPITGALRNALPALAARHPTDDAMTLGAVVPGARDEWGPHPAATPTLTATYLLVPYAEGAAVIVAATAAGLVTVTPDANEVAIRRETVIGGDAAFRVDITDAAVTALGGTLDAVLDHVSVTALAYAVGAAEGALELSVAHARDREQFGRPIGTFQAVAHRCADMRAEIDACRLLAYRAAWALSGGSVESDAGFAVSGALGYAKDALRRVAMHAHQVHGAIGFSTEHDLHRFTRVIKAFELTAGSTARHQERFAITLGLRA